jgi:hypothetical protein
MKNERSTKLRQIATALIATAATTTALLATPGNASAAPKSEPIHYYQMGQYSAYILPLARPTAWAVSHTTDGQAILEVTLRNESSTPTVVEVHSALAGPKPVRVRVPADGQATARIPMTQGYVLDRWTRGLGVSGTITVMGAEYQAGPKHWRKVTTGQNQKYRSTRLAFYDNRGYAAEDIDILPRQGLDPTAPEVATGPSRQSPPEIQAGQLRRIGTDYTRTGGLPEGGTYQPRP